MAGWKELAEAKRASVNSLIPQSWKLSTPLPSVKDHPDITGKYIQQFLTAREVEVTETDAVCNFTSHPIYFAVVYARKSSDLLPYVSMFLWEFSEVIQANVLQVGIVRKIASGAWKAREVTEAFCHRAALAHQMVRFISLLPMIIMLTSLGQLPS